MAQLVIAAAGAWIGGAALGTGVVAFGMTGTAIGWTVGSLIGSAFTPGQKSSGPRMSDLSVSSSAYGTPIPYAAGSPRIAGQYVWASNKREIATTTRQGKGGGKSKSTTYTYEVDLLILLTDNEIAGISRVWRDGKLIWNKSPDATAETIEQSDSIKDWTSITALTGAASQLPHPTYEAAVTNAPAYRGRGGAFIEDLQLGSNGQMPNLTFEIYTQSSATDPALVYSGQTLRATTGAAYGSAVYGSYCYTGAYGGSTIQTFDVSDPTAPVSVDVLAVPTYPGEMVVSGAYLYCTFTFTSQLRIFSLADPAHPAFVGAVALGNKCLGLAVRGNYAYVPVELGGSMKLYVVDVSTPSTPSIAGISDLLGASVSEGHVALSTIQPNYAWVTAVKSGTSHELSVVDISNPGAPLLAQTLSIGHTPYCISIYGSYAFVGYINESYVEVFDISTPTATVAIAGATGMGIGVYSIHAVDGLMFCVNDIGSLYMWDTSVLPSNPVLLQTVSDIGSRVYNISVTDDYVYVARSGLTADTRTLAVYERTGGFEITYPSVRDVVDQMLERSNLPPEKFDTTGLSGITLPVRSLVLSQVSTARSAIELLAQCYFYDIYLRDKLYFIARGGASALTIAYDDLGAMRNGDESPDPLPLTQANELEVPAQISFTYNDVDGDHQSDTQYSDRLLTGQESTSAIQAPLGFTASEAKQIADRMLADQAWRLKTTFSLDAGFTRLEPSDVVQVTDADGKLHRVRILRRSDSGSAITFDAVIDDVSVLTQAGTTSTTTSGQSVVSALPTTTLVLLDIPMLTDSEDEPGLYVAVNGSSTDWALAAIYDSRDGITYGLNTTITDQAAIGTCTTTLGDWAGGNVFDMSNSVTVDIGLIQQLSSYTRDEILTGAAPAYIVGGEILYALDATLVSPGVYTLAGLLRGRRGTESAIATHAASETLVELSPTSNGIRWLALDAADLGSLRYYKGASAGQLLSAVSAQTITPLGTTLKPFSPVDARADRSTADHVITWKPRTRFSTRLTGSLPISAPLPDESYEVEIFASGAAAIAGAPVLRTLTSSSATVTYTSAQRVTDGTGSTVAYIRVNPVSASVGRGTPLIATI